MTIAFDGFVVCAGAGAFYGGWSVLACRITLAASTTIIRSDYEKCLRQNYPRSILQLNLVLVYNIVLAFTLEATFVMMSPIVFDNTLLMRR